MKNIYAKLLKFQGKVEAIKKDSTNPAFRSKYFDINSLLEEVLPVMQEVGLIITQCVEAGPEGKMMLITTLADPDSGETMNASMWLPSCTKPQEYGSAITYFRRYSIQSMLALMAEDDDGNTASGRAPTTSSAAKPAGSFGKFGGKN